MNGVVGEIHVTAAFVNGRHQAFLVGGRPVDGVEIGVVHGVVVRLAARPVELDGTAVGVGDGDVVDEGIC